MILFGWAAVLHQIVPVNARKHEVPSIGVASLKEHVHDASGMVQTNWPCMMSDEKRWLVQASREERLAALLKAYLRRWTEGDHHGFQVCVQNRDCSAQDPLVVLHFPSDPEDQCLLVEVIVGSEGFMTIDMELLAFDARSMSHLNAKCLMSVITTLVHLTMT